MVSKVPLISVVIPTYNRAPFVGEAVESVLNQTFTDYEIIVVDDGSTDNTRESLMRHGDKIKYIHQENLGVSAARNTGIRNSTGTWLAFLDSDDQFRAEYLSRQMERVGQFPGICMQTADCQCYGREGKRRTYFQMNGVVSEFKGRDYLFITEPFRFIVMHGLLWQVGSTIFHRDAVERAGLFDTAFNLAEDFDLMARVALQGPMGILGEVLVNLHRREESTECLTNQIKTNPVQARESEEKVYKKLQQIGTLKYKERKALNKFCSSNRRAIGNLLLERGDIADARKSYRQAFFVDRSARSLAKWLLSYFPMNINLWVSQKLRKKQTLIPE